MKKITIFQLIALISYCFFTDVITTKAQTQPPVQIEYNQLTDNRLEFWVTNLPKVDFNCPVNFNDDNYNFLWYFGDGAYSEQDKPKHEFHDTGTFTVRVEATPIYSTDEPDIIVINTDVIINAAQAKVYPRRQIKHRQLKMRNSRALVPDTEISFVISERFNRRKVSSLLNFPNPQVFPHSLINNNSNVKIVFEYPADKLDFKNAIPANPTVNTSTNQARVTWQTDIMKDSTENIFVALDVKDENIVIHGTTIPFIYKAILNDNFNTPIKVDTLYLKVGDSLDPNKKEVNLSHIAGQQTLKYRVHFQNYGDAPAYKIRIEDYIDDWLDISTLNLTKVVVGYNSFPQLNAYQANINVADHIATFNLNRIRLPGTASAGYDPCSAQSTMGYIEYTIQTIDFSQPFNGQTIADGSVFGKYANIYFDDNAAVRTNEPYTQLDVNNSFCRVNKAIFNKSYTDTLVLTTVQNMILTTNLTTDSATSTVFDAGNRILLKSNTLIQGNSWLLIDGCGAGSNPSFKQQQEEEQEQEEQITQNIDIQENTTNKSYWTSSTKQGLKCYPNPFKNGATIEYELTEESPVHLQVFNMNGQLVANLKNGNTEKVGTHKTYLDASHLANGIYFCKLQTKNEQTNLKLQIFK